MQYHVCDLVIETRDKPFTVMVDSDTDVLLENVIRYEGRGEVCLLVGS